MSNPFHLAYGEFFDYVCNYIMFLGIIAKSPLLWCKKKQKDVKGRLSVRLKDTAPRYSCRALLAKSSHF